MISVSKKSVHVCQSCGFSSPKWLGRCPQCDEWDSLVEERAKSAGAPAGDAGAVPYLEVDSQAVARISSGNPEFDQVLGGGIVPGSLILLGGEPGIGKSTLLLQVAEGLSDRGRTVLYVAGEESAEQIRLRGERLGIDGNRLLLAPETCIESLIEEALRLKPGVVVVDSIQTVYSQKLDSVPGSVGQIKECTAQLHKLAKGGTVPVFLVGHITKDGALAGPKVLEHIVDTVLYFEGDRHQNHKIVRAVKNRFGPANQLAIFQMTNQGLRCVENPSQVLLAERAREVSGSAVLCAMEGTRPVLVEIQALVSQSNYGTGRRTTSGVDPNRVSLLVAVLEQRAGLQLLGSDVYVNVAGKLVLSEPAVDLAILAAVVSSFRDQPLSGDTAVFGEVGLAGEVRGVNLAQARVKEAANLGFSKAVLPRSNLPLNDLVGEVELIGISSVSEYLELVTSWS